MPAGRSDNSVTVFFGVVIRIAESIVCCLNDSYLSFSFFMASAFAGMYSFLKSVLVSWKLLIGYYFFFDISSTTNSAYLPLLIPIIWLMMFIPLVVVSFKFGLNALIRHVIHICTVGDFKSL